VTKRTNPAESAKPLDAEANVTCDIAPLRRAKEKSVNQGRHEAQCSICKHAQREEIEHEFVSWASTTKMAEAYGVSRDSIYRHAHVTGLFPKRQHNVRAALEKIIEKSGEVDVNAAAVVSAVSAYARINANGLWIERRETVDVNQLFERMTREEMETYAKEGTLPDWFTRTVGATATVGGDAENGA
jgi:hypothetical protein